MPKKIPKDASSKVTIKIPRNLYNRLKEIIKDSGFDSVTDFTVYVLRDLASAGFPTKKKTDKAQEPDILTEEEIDAVRKRLKSLGYL